MPTAPCTKQRGGPAEIMASFSPDTGIAAAPQRRPQSTLSDIAQPADIFPLRHRK
jgi:hypothetical protein